MSDKLVDEDLKIDGDFAEEEEEESYVDYDIASYPSDYTLSVLCEMWDKNEIVIPNYQRNYVWKVKQASLLIESFLLGLPVPQLFFYVTRDNKFEVIDGQQRLTSVVYYINGYFGEEDSQGKKQIFRLEGLNKKSPFHKKTFKELDDSSQRKLKGSVLRAMNIRQLSPKDEGTCAYHIFERLNTGGTPLSPQEIRSVVYRGNLVRKLDELNGINSWRKILGKDLVDKRKKDIEIVLRIFCMATRIDHYEKPMKDFLNKSMEINKSGETKEFSEFYLRFDRLCTEIIDALGDKPFHVRGPLNIPSLESVFCILYSGKGVTDGLKEKYEKMIADPKFIEYSMVSTSDLSVINARMKLAKQYLAK